MKEDEGKERRLWQTKGQPPGALFFSSLPGWKPRDEEEEEEEEIGGKAVHVRGLCQLK